MESVEKRKKKKEEERKIEKERKEEKKGGFGFVPLCAAEKASPRTQVVLQIFQGKPFEFYASKLFNYVLEYH